MTATDIRRPRDPRFQRVSSASLTDAIGRRYPHRAHALGLTSPTPGRTLFGRAVTIRCLPRRLDIHDARRHNFARLFYEVVGGEHPLGAGRVLVISSSGCYDTSVAGGTKLSRLENHGLEGVLTDGRLRDFAELAGYSFASWCTGEAVQSGGDALIPCEGNVPVTIKDILILPGDYIFVDRSAAVVIPAADLDWILDEAVRIGEADRRSRDEIRREDPRDILRLSGDEQ